MAEPRKKTSNTFLTRPAFTKEAQAKAQIKLGEFQAGQSRGGSRLRSLTFTDKSNRERQLKMGKAAAKNLVQGTIALNKARGTGRKKPQRTAALPRPPKKKKDL